MDPLRGEVWDVPFPRLGNHPAVVLSINAMAAKLSTVAVCLITGSEGPETTHIPLDTDAGLTGHVISYANATDLHTVPKGKFRSRRGRLHPTEMERLEEAVRVYLGL